MSSTLVKKLLNFVNEAQQAHSVWRADSWQDYEFRDGKQWTQADYNRMLDKGIKPLTINRTFPVMNLVQGHYINNQRDIVAKGRTAEDSELASVMSEGIQYVVDVNDGQRLQSAAFNDSITAGFGCMKVGFNPDPREEKVKLSNRPWYSVWWDPYASPWMNKDDCRYVFYAEWTNLEDLKAAFPKKAKDIDNQFTELSVEAYIPDTYDEGTQIEDYKKYLASNYWVNSDSKRVRPIEMWYTKIEKSFFAIMPNGRVIDLDSIKNVNEEFAVIQQAKEVVTANVKRMRIATMLHNLLLQDRATPFAHDEFPFVPYVGYLDRYNFPFGIPRQIKEQDMEVNKRRSMALALLSNRRVVIEEDSVEDEERTQAEANRPDGFIVMRKGKMGKIQIEEMSNLAPSQTAMQEQSEREIQDIAGTQDLQNPSVPAQSGVAQDKRQQTAATAIASVMENARYSQKMLGDRIMTMIQNNWTDEKVLRVTDRVTGTEKFVTVNERFVDNTGITVRNDITQASFDLVIANKPMTDTVREKNMELIFSAINKSPQEAVGPLLNLALELSDIPNKDLLLQQVREVTGMSPLDTNLTKAERDEKAVQEAQARQEEADKKTSQENMTVMAAQDKDRSVAELNRAKAREADAKAKAALQDVDQKGYQIGVQSAQMIKGSNKVNSGKGDQPKPKKPDNNVVPQEKKNER